MSTDAQTQAAAKLASGVAYFLSSLPFMAPEIVGFQANIKLMGPLRRYQNQRAENALEELS